MSSPQSARTSHAVTRALTSILFSIYLALLVWIVLWKLGVPSVGGGELRAVKLVPFVASGGYGVSSPFEMVANVALFIPFGLYLRLIAPSWRWWTAVVIAAIASVVLEATQYALAVGSTDVTDVILNTTGALIGVGVAAAARQALRARASTVMVRLCSVATVLALAASAAFVASPLRYGPPPGELTRMQR